MFMLAYIIEIILFHDPDYITEILMSQIQHSRSK